jgi:hypothetical protein
MADIPDIRLFFEKPQKILKLPDVGMGLVELTIIKWLVTVGDYVKEDQDLVRLEWDAGITNLPSPYSGVILGLCGSPGDTIRVGTPLVLFASEERKREERFLRVMYELGGEDRVSRFFEQLWHQGIHVQGYCGGGGWGHVFRVSREDDNKPIALKIFKLPYLPPADEAKWRRRLEEEGSTLRKLSGHAGIVKPVGSLEEIEGLPFLQMEYVLGKPLAEMNLPMEPLRAIELIRKTLEALQHVHQLALQRHLYAHAL